MKKIFKIISIMTVALLFLQGCAIRDWFKRQELEQRFDAMSKVYPTEKVSDLFEVFPNGFEIKHSRDEYKEDEVYYHYLNFEGDPTSKKITGNYKKVFIDELSNNVVIFDIPIEYSDDQGVVALNGGELDSFIFPFKFGFQLLTINRGILEKLENWGWYEHPMINDYGLNYYLSNEKLNRYLNINEEEVLDMTIGGGSRDTSDDYFGFSIDVFKRNVFGKHPKHYFYESVREGTKE